MKEKNSYDQDILKRSIHWYALGKMEFGNKIDRFIKFWIALELLASNEKGKNEIRRLKNVLKTVYSEIDKEIEQSDIHWRIYHLRTEIFHKGKLLSGELQGTQLNIDTQLRQTEDIFTDILRYKLGLSSRNLAKKYYL